MSSITIVDYGMGNLRSVQKALERLGTEAVVTSDAQQIAEADKVILPGVGAFRDAIQALHDHKLVDVIKDTTSAGKPFLGICLGLQLLFDVSYEDGEFQGLGIVPGKVTRFELPAELKIPHMGWNQLHTCTDNPLLNNIRRDAWFYFVHSYYVQPDDDSWTAATTDYGGEFVSIVARDNVFATQFHPEKSQSTGLQLLRNFVEL
ncbi:MAG: imidazole glycerol phosphate synthase subunit HisH [Fuerstiella sp.]|nr:imidazole glycerol phosphate synthase subunit HisH [Fuerstiella sp.]